MSTAAAEKIKKEIKQELLQEFILPILKQAKDAEGEYRDDFVRGVLEALRENPKRKYSAKTLGNLIAQ